MNELIEAGRALVETPSAPDDRGDADSTLAQRLQAFTEKHLGAESRSARPPAPVPAVDELREAQARTQAQANDLWRRGAEIRAQAAALQRELAATRTLEVVDPIAAHARQVELGQAVLHLQQMDRAHYADIVAFDEALLDATGQALWGKDSARQMKELPELLQWAAGRGISEPEINYLARNPTQARVIYDAWQASLGQAAVRQAPPAVKPVARPDGKPPAPRPSRNRGQARDLELGGAILRKAGLA